MTQNNKRIEKHYSGKNSEAFWKLINEKTGLDLELYKRACDLQELEDEIFRSLPPRVGEDKDILIKEDL